LRLNTIRDHDLVQRVRSVSVHGLALAEQGGMSALNFVSVAALGRCLDHREFALYVLLYAAISLPYLVSSTFWTYPAMVLLPKQPEGGGGDYSKIVLLCNAATMILLGALALVLADWFIKPFSLPAAVAALLVGLSWGNYDCIRRLAYAAHEGRRLVVPSLLLIPVYGLAIHVLWRSGRLDAQTALLSLAFSFLVSGAAAGFLLRAAFGTTRPTAARAREVVARHWRLARWLIPGSSAYFVTSHGFFLLGARMLTDTELGSLRAAQNLVNVMTVALLAFENYYVPRASAVLHREGTDALYRFVGVMYARAMVVFGSATLAIAPAAYVGFQFLYGEKYPGYQNFVFLFAAYQFVLTLSVPAQVAWNTQEKTYVCMTSTVAAAVVACLVAVPLMVWGRALGAALGMLVSVSTMTAVLVLALAARARGVLFAGAFER
jgi:O-antigen/teichoic acid export membrane protein